MNTEFSQYPIGKPSIESEPGERIEGCIAVIGRMPKQLMEFEVLPKQWDTPYREGGWTVLRRATQIHI